MVLYLRTEVIGMDSIMEELYDRRFITKTDSAAKQKEKLSLSAMMDRHEKKLNELLNDDGKDILEKYRDCYDETNSGDCRDAFLSGFRMGGKLVMEILFGTESIELNE